MSDPDFLETTPKAELHLHLEGAAPPDFIRQLAFEKKITLNGLFRQDGSYAYQDFAGFLKAYEAACSVLQSPQDFARLTRTVLDAQKAHNTIYTECFVSPEFCGKGDLGAWRDYLAALQEVAQDASGRDNIELRIIVTAVRHMGPDAARDAALCAAETASDFVVGFGMGGAEDAFSYSDFAYAYDMAREAKLGLTCHAGEWGDAASIREMLKALQVRRIGHGIRAIEDQSLLETIKEHNIAFELCPLSNLSLGAVTSHAAHPVRQLFDQGHNISISTDDPPYFGSTMTEELRVLRQHHGFEPAEIQRLTKMAIDAAFCDDISKSQLHSKLQETS